MSDVWRPQFIEVDGVRLCYRRAGDGAPVVLLHGFRGSSRYWTSVAAALANRWSVIAPDLKGFGESAKPRSGYTLADHALTVRRLLARLGVTSATIVGHSLGGVVALHLLAEFPELVRRLVLVTTPLTGTVEQNLGELQRAPLWMRLLVGRPRLARWVVGLPSQTLVRLGSDTSELTREAIQDAVKFCWASLHGTFDSCIVRSNMRQRLQPSAVPTLLLYGDRDDLVDLHHARDLQRLLDPSSLVVVPGAGHQLPASHQQAFLQAVTAFLAAKPDASLPLVAVSR